MWQIKLAVLICGLATAGALFPYVKVCYGDLGCFTSCGEICPDERPVNFLPESPQAIDARFWLINRDDPVGVPMTYNDEEAILKSTFDAKKPTKFLIHGYKSSTSETWIHDAAKELLVNGDYNVFIVDWKRGAEVNYAQVFANTQVVGAEISVLLNKLKEIKGANPMTFHLIGSDVGAHLAGHAGRRLDGLLGRITGLDPAAPYFEHLYSPTVESLYRADADFVDVIHTNTGNSLDFGFGMHSLIGDIDFYPNGGDFQPGCPKTEIVHRSTVGEILGLLNQNKSLAKEKFMCSHRRAEQLFVESINSKCPFLSFPCTSADNLHIGKCLHGVGLIGRMGFYADLSLGVGVRMLETYDKAPFCAYHYQIKVAGASTIDGKVYITITGTEGKTGVIDIYEQNKLMSPHELYQSVFKTKVNVGHVTSIEVKYVETPNLAKILFDDDWKMESLTLFQGYRQKEYNFCVKDVIITSTTSKIFKPADVCP